MARERNTNLDVLRCVAMLCIVLCHVYQHDKAIVQETATRDFLFLNLIRWHVDVFLCLSGWFGMKFSLKKFGKIWGVMAFYSGISIAIGRFVLGDATPIKIDGGWFGNAYLCLLLIVPFLNAGIEGLLLRGVKLAWMAWFGFAAMITINWISPTAYFGISAWDIHSHTLVNMVYVYFTARIFKLTGLMEHVRGWHVCVAVIVFVGGCLVLGNRRTDYIAPYTVAMAIAMLALFEKFLKVPAWLGRLCVWISPSMFGVYLLHGPTSFGKYFHRVPLRFLVEHGVSPELAIVISAFICFGFCLMLDLFRRYSLRGIIRLNEFRLKN